jgi:excisionase family DNA binding protein
MIADNEAPTPGPSNAIAKLLLTVPEAAAALGVSRSVFYQLILAGEIRSVKIGRSRRVPLVVLEEFVTQQLANQRSA